MYLKRDFANALSNELEKEYDAIRIARWTFETYLEHADELEPGLRTEMMTLIAMDAGPEFELDEASAKSLCARLRGAVQ
jgi:hypothetical protein